MPNKAVIALTVALLVFSLTACIQDVDSQLIEAGGKAKPGILRGCLRPGLKWMRKTRRV